jgi:hypothetical protein
MRLYGMITTLTCWTTYGRSKWRSPASPEEEAIEVCYLSHHAAKKEKRGEENVCELSTGHLTKTMHLLLRTHWRWALIYFQIF